MKSTVNLQRNYGVRVMVMVFDATFNKISVISGSHFFVEETGVPGENHWHAASH